MTQSEEDQTNSCTYCQQKQQSEVDYDEFNFNCYACEQQSDLSSSPPSPSNPPIWSTHRPTGASIHLHPHSLWNRTNTVVDTVSMSLNRIAPQADLCNLDYLHDDEEQLNVDDIVNDVRIFPKLESQHFYHESNSIMSEDDEFSDEQDYAYDAHEKMIIANNMIEAKRLLLNSWLSPEEFLTRIKDQGYNGLQAEYTTVCKIHNADRLKNFKKGTNRQKNRYNDVVCYDHNRVKIRCKRDPLLMNEEMVTEPTSTTSPNKATTTKASNNNISSDLSDGPFFEGDTMDDESQEEFSSPQNYIHANWVDSYRQKNAFICTQGPLKNTIGDFWRLVWDYHVPVIVMITKTYESSRQKCSQYWPKSGTAIFTDSDQSQSFSFKSQHSLNEADSVINERSQWTGNFTITKVHCVNTENYSKSLLRIKFSKTGEERNVHHYAFNSWPDHGVPKDTTCLLDLLSSVNATYLCHLQRHHGYTSIYDQEIPPPPIVVHCSAGIGRTGTFISLDICTKALSDGLQLRKEDEQVNVKINIPLTVARIRHQRAGCVQVPAQYIFCYRTLLSYMHQMGILSQSDVENGNMYLNSDDSQRNWCYPYSSYQMKEIFQSNFANIMTQNQQYPTQQPTSPITISGTQTVANANSQVVLLASPKNNNNNNTINTGNSLQTKFTDPSFFNATDQGSRQCYNDDVPLRMKRIVQESTGQQVKATNDPFDDLSDYENDESSLMKTIKNNPHLMTTTNGNTDNSTKSCSPGAPSHSSHSTTMSECLPSESAIIRRNIIHNPLSLSEYETEDENYGDMKGTMNFETILS